MEYGIALASNVDAWKTVKRAEELGFSHAWFYDTQLLAPDVFIAMALAAEHTSKIKLGTGVLVPSNRIAPVAAAAFAPRQSWASLGLSRTSLRRLLVLGLVPSALSTTSAAGSSCQLLA